MGKNDDAEAAPARHDGCYREFVQRFLHVEPDARKEVVRVVRNSVPAQSVEDLEATWGGLHARLALLKDSHRSLLLDLRRARGRNDEAFEAVIQKYRAATLRGFAKVAVLVRTLPGKMQVERHARIDGLGTVRAFMSETEGLDWLRA